MKSLAHEPNSEPLLELRCRDRAVIYAALCAWLYDDNPLCFISRNHGVMTQEDFHREVTRIKEGLELTHLDVVESPLCRCGKPCLWRPELGSFHVTCGDFMCA
jgi:hypothetical protein